MTKQDYETPEDFFQAVNSIWPICFDLAAHRENKKKMAYFSPEDDSLQQPWHKILPQHRHTDGPNYLWLNPPFQNFTPWARKCSEEAELGAKIVMLGISPCTRWWRKYCEGKCLTILLESRVTFVDEKTAYPKDLMLMVWGTGLKGLITWNWRK